MFLRSLSHCKALCSFAVVSLLFFLITLKMFWRMLIKTKQEMIQQQIQEISILLIGFVKFETKQWFLTLT